MLSVGIASTLPFLIVHCQQALAERFLGIHDVANRPVFREEESSPIALALADRIRARDAHFEIIFSDLSQEVYAGTNTVD